MWKNKPSPYRSYAGAEVIALPPAKRLMQPALEVIAAARPAPAEKAPRLNLEILHAILFLSGGITGKRPSGGDIRATAAAGALYPNEMYVVSGKLPDLAAGIYHYDPKRARLSRLREGDWRGALAQAAADEQIRNADATLALTGIPWRSAWKYRERAYRHLYWDGGMKLAHVLAAAEAVPLPATLVAGFIDDQVDQLLGIDGTTEGSMALVPLGARADPAEPPPSEQPPPLSVRASPLSPHPIDYPEAQRYHRASRLADRAAVHRFRSARMVLPKARRDPSSAVDLPPPAPARSDPSLDAVIRRRRSTRHFARRAISAAELAAALQLSTRGAPADFLTHQPTLLETYVIVNSVQGINAGAYYYNRSRHRLDLLRPENFRREAGFLCLGQELARDASAVLFHMANLNAIFVAFGERGYRLAEMEAGLISGRVYLAAYAVGRGATGLTFFDDEVTRFFSPHAAALEPLLVTAVGVPR
jgi:SagB-type dehydrogenase family enzyme